jgi:RNA polymerase sigma-70 factor (ECF subfamily)
MRAAARGDAAAYRQALEQLAPWLRAIARRGLARVGHGTEDAEDIVQDTMLAIHLKWQTWDTAKPFEPWVRAVARHKLIDHLRRRGDHVTIPIDDVLEILEAQESPSDMDIHGPNGMLQALEPRQRSIVEMISIEGRSAREVGTRLGLSEGTVRVALHRALKSLAAKFRDE